MPQPLVRDLEVVGTFYRPDDTKAKLAGLVGQTLPVGFQPEPENPHDPHACAVLVELDGAWLHVGYVPRTVSALFIAGLNRECQASAVVVAHKGGAKVIVCVDSLP